MRLPVQLPDIQILRSLLSYNHETGQLVWLSKAAKNTVIGAIAGKPQKPHGYVQIGINKKIYYAHRLAWKLYYGTEPKGVIDHINGNRTDNRIANLRDVSNCENVTNSHKNKRNTTGYKGVCYNKKLKKYQANICKNYVQHHLGLFDTPEEAHAAYCEASQRLHGPFGSTSYSSGIGMAS